jgi:catechol 2,3-dioxygenase
MTERESESMTRPPAGYRLPATAHVGRVTLQVSDLGRSIAYYTDVLGLRAEPLASSTGPRRAWLRPQNDERVLLELCERTGARRVPERSLLGLFHFAIVVPDRAALGRVLAHFIDAAVPFGAADHMVSEALYLTDPDGLGIELYRDRPRAEWIIHGGQVMGGSDPLDAAGILAAAEHGAWNGLPAGTRMGHVHFHVGDLPRAEAFYHRGLGFDIVNWKLPGALFLSAGGYHHHVGLNTWAAGAPPASDEDARLIEWELVVLTVDDAKNIAENLAASDHAVDVRSGECAASDPWGTVVRVHASGPTS